MRRRMKKRKTWVAAPLWGAVAGGCGPVADATGVALGSLRDSVFGLTAAEERRGAVTARRGAGEFRVGEEGNANAWRNLHNLRHGNFRGVKRNRGGRGGGGNQCGCPANCRWDG